MSVNERKAFVSKIEAAQENFKIIRESREKIGNLNGAIEYLEEENKRIKQPNEPNYQNVYDNKLKSLTEEYDKTHKPKKPHIISFFVWLTIIVSTVCLLVFFSEFETWSQVSDAFKIIFLVGILPIFLLFLNILSIILYKPRLNNYLKNNKARLLEIEKFKPEAEKAVERSREFYRTSCVKYEECLVGFEKIERYRIQWRDLRALIKRKEAELSEFFDEMQTPQEYRNEYSVIVIKSYFESNESDVDSDKKCVIEFFDQVYIKILQDDQEEEFQSLARRNINSDFARMDAEVRAMREAEAEKQRRKWAKEEEERKAEEYKKLEKFAEIVDNQ